MGDPAGEQYPIYAPETSLELHEEMTLDDPNGCPHGWAHYWCTRLAGHSGPHEAGIDQQDGTTYIVARWWGD